MDKLQLKTQKREAAQNPAKLRKQGLVPAILYGHNVTNQSLTLNLGEFEKILKRAGESTIVDLLTPDGKSHPVLIHEVQRHYLTSVPTHVDFYEVSMTEKLKAKVVLDFTGEAKAVKELGGVLVRNLNEVEVECLPADLPHSLVVNIAALVDFSSVVLVKNLPLPANVKILTPAEEVIAKVQPPRDVEAELAVPVVEDVSKVEGAAEDKPVEAGTAPAAEAAKAEKEKKA